MRNADENNCKDRGEGVFLSQRMVSSLSAAFLLLLFAAFITGYFLGQKRAIQRFVQQVDHDAFSDNVYATLCTFEDQRSVTEEDTSSVSVEPQEVKEAVVLKKKSPVTQKEEPATPVATAQSESYYASLIGFGTEQAAQRFVRRLEKRSIPVVIKRRVSRSAQGKKVVWYQVNTKKFENKATLLELIELIKEKEKLEGIQIHSCSQSK